MSVHFLFVFDLLVICWESAVPSAFHLCCVHFSAVLIVGVHFPVWCLGQDVEFDCIGSLSLPFYLQPAAMVRDDKHIEDIINHINNNITIFNDPYPYQFF